MDALHALGDEIPKKDELYYFAIKMFQTLVKRFLNLDPDVRQHPHFPSNHTINHLHHKLLRIITVMDEFKNIYNSFDMNYDTPELSEEAQRRIATIVT
ncbi:hypothetical protein J1N35_020943 [Gossypium stocksii]|uniref:Uncharacterized protein n=1 Tax=Gossypium stocksii TaxID=47602 RepID=A0A9D3VES7_9ROSI|nr:hypothetical protein J1N35_020943 [Gossypium stocksii]